MRRPMIEIDTSFRMEEKAWKKPMKLMKIEFKKSKK